MPIRKLHTIRAHHVNDVGGKAASLGELAAAGHPVPPGFAITADEHELSDTLRRAIMDTFDELQLSNVAVRSSGIGEDSKEQSWAGQFATTLHVDRHGLADAISTCWESAKSTRAAAYANSAIFDIAVFVQHMVHSDAAGVAFSVNPITGNRNEIIIEAVYGLGELLVQGLATPDNFIVDKSTGNVLTQDIAAKTTMLTYRNGATTEVAVSLAQQSEPALMRSQLGELAALVRNVEAHYNFPVDIEWAFQGGRLYLLQARPITTL